MVIVFGLGLGLLLGGLLVMWLSPSAHNSILVAVVWWIGLVLVLFGVILLATPILVYIYNQVQAMLGVDGGRQQLNR